MKKIGLACLLIIAAASANAGTIHDIQTGLAEEGTLQAPCDAVVVAVNYNGVWVAEEPYGAYDGIWVYMGSDEPITLVPGDVVCICGEYKEYFGLSEIDLVAAGIYGSIVVTGTVPVPEPSYVAAADLMADPEPWESCAITIVDGMEVTNPDLGFGEWEATALDGTVIVFDDIFYDDPVALGDCYNNATGILNFGFDVFKLEAYADGIALTDCTVPTDASTLSSIKALYR